MTDVVDTLVDSSVAVRRRDRRIVVFETIGCALAALRRLNVVCDDEDIRKTLTTARSALSSAQSKVKERIEETFVKRKSE